MEIQQHDLPEPAEHRRPQAGTTAGWWSLAGWMLAVVFVVILVVRACR